jgi:hypothetical protein
MGSDQALGEVVDSEHLFVVQCSHGEQVFGKGVAMSVALELEYESFYPRLRVLPEVPGRPARRARIQRRRILLGVAALVLLVLLMLPIRAFGGKPVASSVPTAGQEYIVQPGDTIASIAAQVDHGGAAGLTSLTSRLAAEVGSTVVVPGEHLLIP